MIDEGYIKYRSTWICSPSVTLQEIQSLNQWRNQLYQLGLIGEYENGIGFGNLSLRTSGQGKFIISGTKTGSLPTLTEKHYTRVIDFDVEQNAVTCKGLIEASSESLTHAVIYSAHPSIQSVIHVHHFALWQHLMDQVPTTAKDCPYGTPEMAKEMLRLFTEENLLAHKILVMAGHEEGVLAFGETLNEAGTILLKYFNSLKSCNES